jgi:hypothetical protein
MLTTDTITVESITAEIAALDKSYKAKRKELLPRVRAAMILHGKNSNEHLGEKSDLDLLETAVKQYRRKFVALRDVACIEMIPVIQKLMADDKAEQA